MAPAPVPTPEKIGVVSALLHTDPEKMARMWFGEIPSSYSLTLLIGPAPVLLNYVLQTIFLGPLLHSIWAIEALYPHSEIHPSPHL